MLHGELEVLILDRELLHQAPQTASRLRLYGDIIEKVGRLATPFILEQ